MTQYINQLNYYFQLLINSLEYVGNNIGSYPGFLLLVAFCVIIFVVRMIKFYSGGN